MSTHTTPDRSAFDSFWSATPANLAHALSKGKWRHAPHLDMLSDALVDAVGGSKPRLIVAMPPRHGKSELD